MNLIEIDAVMSQVTPKVSAIQIVQPKSDHTFELKIDVLEKILSADDIRDRNVVVVSIAGALRQGKSFLLNFFLQYLYAQVSKNEILYITHFHSFSIITFSFSISGTM